jgi:ribonuclease D
LKQRCEDFGVAQKLVASSDDIEAIAADDAAGVRALSGWRRDVFGADALALKHGRLALTAGRNRIELVAIRSSEEAA